MYDPTIGRWIQEDPIDFDGDDLNLYRMEGNDPINNVDPSGLQKIAPGPKPGTAFGKPDTIGGDKINPNWNGKPPAPWQPPPVQPSMGPVSDNELVRKGILPGSPGLDRLYDSLAGISTSAEAKCEARKIAAAINNTYINNLRVTVPPQLNPFPDHRIKGYYCWDWAYGFEDAFKLESKGKYFKAKVEGARSLTSDTLHFWLTITSLETKKIIYVDDSWGNGNFVNDKMPMPPLGYMSDPGISAEKPRIKANPPTAYNGGNQAK